MRVKTHLKAGPLGIREIHIRVNVRDPPP